MEGSLTLLPDAALVVSIKLDRVLATSHTAFNSNTCTDGYHNNCITKSSRLT